jgi:hypothetical protein
LVLLALSGVLLAGLGLQQQLLAQQQWIMAAL